MNVGELHALIAKAINEGLDPLTEVVIDQGGEWAKVLAVHSPHTPIDFTDDNFIWLTIVPSADYADSRSEYAHVNCGADARRRGCGDTFTDPICRRNSSHSGAHVGLHKDGTRTGF